MSASVYIITHVPTCRHYVGKARNPRERWQQHLRGTSNRVSHIQRALASHGRHEFQFQEIERFDSDAEAYEAESFWIEFLRSNVDGFGFNLSLGGEGNRGYLVTDVTRAKQSATMKARWARPGERERNGAQTKRVHTGLKRSRVTCDRISAKATGRAVTEAQRKKISQAQLGKPKPGTSEKLRGRPKSADHVAKVAEANRGMKRSAETRQRMRDAWARRRAANVTHVHPASRDAEADHGREQDPGDSARRDSR